MSSVLSVAADWETKKKNSIICHKMIGRFKIKIHIDVKKVQLTSMKGKLYMHVTTFDTTPLNDINII